MIRAREVATQDTREANAFLTAALDRGVCSRRETAVFALLATLMGFSIYGLHVLNGGFILDDWAYAAEYEIHGRDLGFLGFADRLLNDPDVLLSAGGRPVGALYFAGMYSAFGSNMALHIACGVVLSITVSTLLFVVLRTLGLERVHAGVIAALVLVFPASDSIRFWPAAATSLAALSFYLAGLAVALAGLRTAGRRAVVLHGCAALLFTLSLLQYEIAAGFILLGGLIYALRSGWRRALPRWGADVAVVGVCLLYLRSTTTRKVASASDLLDQLRLFQGEARTVLSQAGLQDGRTLIPVAGVAVVLLVAFVVLACLNPDDAVHAALRRWLATAIAGGIAIGAGYVIFAGAEDSFYRPLREGIGNRTNGAAMIGYVILLYALAVVAGLVLGRGLVWLGAARSAAGPALAIALVGAGALGGLWIREVNEDRRAWNAAYAIEDQTVAVLREHVPKPPPGSTLYSFGLPGETTPLVHAFTADWDLTGAVRWLYRDETLQGVPSASIVPTYVANTEANSGIACRPNSVRPRGWFWDDADASPYGRTIFVHVPTREVRVIRTPRECRRAVADFL